MRIKTIVVMALVIIVLVLAGCQAGGLRGYQDEPEMLPVKSLVEEADAAMLRDDFAAAEHALERALRMAPQSPSLYGRLAQLRQAEKQFAEAEQLARKAINLAGNNNRQKARFWRLVAAIRQDAGDSLGSEAALDAAEGFARK